MFPNSTCPMSIDWSIMHQTYLSPAPMGQGYWGLKGTITNWSDIVFLLKPCILQEERLTGWKMK